MRGFLPLCLAATQASAAEVAFAPLLDAQTAFANQGGVQVATVGNALGGPVTASVLDYSSTPTQVVAWAGLYDYIDGHGMRPTGVVIFGFSEPVTRFAIGWVAPTGSWGFYYHVYRGGTAVDTVIVNAFPDHLDEQAYSVYDNPDGFTWIQLFTPQGSILGYGSAIPVPEPSATGVIFGALALAAVAVRRRRGAGAG